MIAINRTQGELAAELGANRSTLNRALRELEELGLIAVDGERVTLLILRGSRHSCSRITARHVGRSSEEGARLTEVVTPFGRLGLLAPVGGPPQRRGFLLC